MAEQEKAEVLLKVKEKYEPPKEIVERVWIKDYESLYDESIKGGGGTPLVQKVGQGLGVEVPLRQVVHRREDKHNLQLS